MISLDSRKRKTMIDSDGSAQAVEAVAKAADTGLRLLDSAGGFLSKVAKGPIAESMALLEDRVRFTRFVRQARFFQEAAKIAENHNLTLNRPLTLKLLCPLIEAAVLEEDDSLQDRWARLLINSTSADSEIELRASYIDMLKRLTTLDAQVLDKIYGPDLDPGLDGWVFTEELPERATLGREGSVMRPAPVRTDVRLSLSVLDSLGCLKMGTNFNGSEVFSTVNWTALGVAFVRACSQIHLTPG